MLGGHGLFTWAEDGKACYETTLRIIQRAQDWLDANNRPPRSAGRVEALPEDERGRVVQELLPWLRGRIASAEPKVGHVDMTPAVLEFVNSNRLEELAAPGHVLPRPLPAHQDQRCMSLVVPAEADDATLDAAGRGLPPGLRGLLRALQARRQPGHARSEPGGLS